ncbi:3943_t:CDS:2 [Diversispora eburnea]|uniref:3943_t:CDS:1 n=1 Tax=Diversispora eburnea TaxID=1213867 RepID=A0A9N8VVK9_9GLOM|nr:3943_t:CDS:2 [Diversispora eburnea]
MEEKLWKSISHNYISLLEDKDTCDVTITVGKSIHHILGILTAADELILPTLTEHVENYLIKNKTTLIQNHPVEVLKVSFQNEGWKTLQDNCISVICNILWNFILPERPKKNPVLPKRHRHHPYNKASPSKIMAYRASYSKYANKPNAFRKVIIGP